MNIALEIKKVEFGAEHIFRNFTIKYKFILYKNP